jgi:hypothetical protein
MRGKFSFFLLLIGIAIFISLPVQCVYAYTSQQYIPYQQYSFWYNYTPAGPDPSQEKGFIRNDPIRYNTAEWDSQLGVLHCRAYAMVPMGTTQGYRPNVNVTARLFYNGYFSRPFSYLEVAALNPYLSIRAYHDPPADMGNAEYGYSITRIDAVGGTYYTATAAELYSLADFWYPNNEAAWDYAEADVTLSISGTIITFHWTQLDISASPNPAWKSQPVQFTATLKDGVPPYTVQWNFGGQGTYTAQVSGSIGGVLTSQTQFSFTSAGTFNVTCTATDSRGISDTKWVLITVRAVYLTIQSTSGGTTSPAPGVYAYPAGATAQVSAQPSSGYSFDRWQLDGVDAGSSSTFTVVMNANHTLRALFAQTPSYSPATLTFDIRYYDGMKWAQGDIVPYGIVRYSGAATGQVYSSPTTVTVNVQGTGDVYAYFDPRNTQGSGFVSQWGGTPKAKVYSSYYYIANTTYSQNVAPSSITYPNQYDMLIISGYSHVLSMNVKWAEYPVNVSANAQWGTVTVTSNSPGWSLYSSQYLNYTNGFGVYYVDHSYNIRVQALPFAGYYFDRIVVDGNTTYYDDTVLLDNVVGPHNVTVYFSAVPPTFKLTIQAGDGGTTIPSPGVYYVPRYSYQSVVAYVTAPGYYFSNWLVDSTTDRTGAGTSTSKITVYMDRDHTVTAAFDTEGTVPVRPCYIRDGTQLSRVTLGETVGVNVTVTLPGITSPTNVQVTAWLEGVRWWDWSTNSFRTTTYKFTGTATTNASGFFTVAFGSEIDRSSTCYSVDPSTPLGTQYLARAEVKVGSNTYTYANTWKVDNVMATAEFDYNLTGVNATFRFVYVTDGAPARGRNGLYVTALSTGHPYTPEAYSIVNGTSTIRERLSPPCDRDAASRLFIPYSWLNNSTLRATVPLPVWLDYSVYGMGLIPSGYAVVNNITYTTDGGDDVVLQLHLRGRGALRLGRQGEPAGRGGGSRVPVLGHVGAPVGRDQRADRGFRAVRHGAALQAGREGLRQLHRGELLGGGGAGG